MTWKTFAAAIGLSMLATSAAQATTVTINSFDNGWYRSNGEHGDNNSNIIDRPINNNFFAFDLTGVSLPSITSAVLTIFAGNGSYLTGDASETMNFYDVSTDIDSLLAGTGGVAAFNDLGSGTLYGAATVQTPQSRGTMPQVTSTLTTSAVAALVGALNGTDKRFVVGGNSPTLSGNQYLWGFSGGIPAAALTLTYTAPQPNPNPTPTPAPVPLPAAGWMLLAGLGGLAFVSRRRNSA